MTALTEVELETIARAVRQGLTPSRNVEVGVLVEGEKFARELVHQWRNAAEAGVFRQVVDT